MSKHRWNYSGDVDIRQGGLFWREDDADDYVLAVRITPCSEGGGPDNLYYIENGSLYLPNDFVKRKSALGVIGVEPGYETRAQLVEAFVAYHGIDHSYDDGEYVVQLSAKQETPRNGWSPQPDKVLRGNASLKKFVRNKFLR